MSRQQRLQMGESLQMANTGLMMPGCGRGWTVHKTGGSSIYKQGLKLGELSEILHWWGQNQTSTSKRGSVNQVKSLKRLLGRLALPSPV